MPNKASQADITTDAEQLLTATAGNQSLLPPNIEKHRAPVEQTLAEVKALKAAQKQLAADKQKATQDLRAAIRRLQEQTIFLRTAIRGEMGPRTEKLVEFGIAPLRKPTRRKKPAELPEMPAASPQP